MKLLRLSFDKPYRLWSEDEKTTSLLRLMNTMQKAAMSLSWVRTAFTVVTQ